MKSKCSHTLILKTFPPSTPTQPLNSRNILGFSKDGAWSLPAGTIWIKHFDLEMTNGVPSSARRLETRFLVRTSTG
ncbi:MAG TPA: hypothetical protein VHI52_07215, partial [Verrucomicrobiae bacterium]|nr:hypothetical protein [Verrucomicrobiae bacterium]